MDIQFALCERSTIDYPVSQISLSVDSPIDELFESSLPADLSFPDYDDLSYSSSDLSSDNGTRLTLDMFSRNQVLPSPDDYYYDIDGFTGFPISSCPLNVMYNTTLTFLSNSDDELVDLDDESLFLSFDEETFTYHETEWIELFFCTVYFSFIPVYICTIVYPFLSASASFLDLRVVHGRQMFWKIFAHFSGLEVFLVIPLLLTANFKFYNRVFCLQPFIYDQITRFACLFEIFAVRLQIIGISALFSFMYL
ncbi:uncharacterized protein OCT59_003239 [Rhizophagus irregularis]|uniref:Uncharacterized protein n=2 Tax=Rhizophagus irregularis TaxID=588596 RepID=U9U4G5_RHIID|nr:hypothetical protein GLOIN_2v1779240 [Rhizophagus irregularis DAOM 181602=DAOM 197198]EXX71850.1 hypothetical protein RirG_074850 [Rhizophagus irregularis DAOM 197198w]POG67626.1 hypothetical protein GLOIN_2v1779240 [Rhizophagus irregularis DAOM 181602=DAOM 197198]UZO11680.1 hypothetical protein OCT59_003239 [Rhizophagus irregularis]GBC37101.1 hypothetical protein GLOIN_2v1779240 [Rhizophagus irregularis DAOM 181602=DAOM 197198]|eukprot:XP_025174492.1 hypothetical protein GLOIN_2v1779240 [Rhizophagus irregularis DAOM 181602=DAOM 197198]